MSLLLESICLHDGKLPLMDYHQTRIIKSCQKIFGRDPKWNLNSIIKASENYPLGLYKLRIEYDIFEYAISVKSYKQPSVRKIKIVNSSAAQYDYKWADRSLFNHYRNVHKNYDDILIIRNGYITDTSIFNIALRIKNAWLTPKKPLLKGVQRAYLLDNTIIKESKLTIESLSDANSIMLFNALNPWGKLQLSPEQIVP